MLYLLFSPLRSVWLHAQALKKQPKMPLKPVQKLLKLVPKLLLKALKLLLKALKPLLAKLRT
ncbi:hypothetical protein, partial [Sphingorhabdus sp.]